MNCCDSSRISLGDWLAYQRDGFPTIDGMLLLDDIVGFIGEEDFQEFAQPYLKGCSPRSALASVSSTTIRRQGLGPAPPDTGINLFNIGHRAPLKDSRDGRMAR